MRSARFPASPASLFRPDVLLQNEEQVYAELCGIIRDEVAHRQEKGEALPHASVRVTRDVELVAA